MCIIKITGGKKSPLNKNNKKQGGFNHGTFKLIWMEQEYI
jgi:hypothetical protein